MGIQNKITENVSVFYVENRLNGCKPTNMKKQNNITEKVCFYVFELVTYKKKKHCISGNKRTLRETCIMSVIQFHKNLKAKNAKTREYGGVSQIKKNAETEE